MSDYGVRLSNSVIMANAIMHGEARYSDIRDNWVVVVGKEEFERRRAEKKALEETPLKSPTTPRPMPAGDASENKIPATDT